jgi:hypothetical protein
MFFRTLRTAISVPLRVRRLSEPKPFALVNGQQGRFGGMSKTVVEKVYGRDAIYEIRRVDGGVFGSDSFQVYRVGKNSERWVSSHKSLAEAVERAESEA